MRKKAVLKRQPLLPDLRHNSLLVTKLTNYVMREGKKSIASKIVNVTLEKIEQKTKKNGLEILETAVANVSPEVEVRSRRIGGATYQVPMEVRPERKLQLALRWITGTARAKQGKPMAYFLADELIAAANKEGEAIHKRELMHKAAEANKAFAHLARY